MHVFPDQETILALHLHTFHDSPTSPLYVRVRFGRRSKSPGRSARAAPTIDSWAHHVPALASGEEPGQARPKESQGWARPAGVALGIEQANGFTCLCLKREFWLVLSGRGQEIVSPCLDAPRAMVRIMAPVTFPFY